MNNGDNKFTIEQLEDQVSDLEHDNSDLQAENLRLQNANGQLQKKYLKLYQQKRSKK